MISVVKVLQFGNYGASAFAGKFADPMHQWKEIKSTVSLSRLSFEIIKFLISASGSLEGGFSGVPVKIKLSRILLACISNRVSLILLFSEVRVSACLVSVATDVCNDLFSF